MVKKIIKDNELANYKIKRDVVNVLSSADVNGESHKISERHINDIKEMLGEDRIFH